MQSYLAELYLSKSFEQVHQPWLEYLTPILNKTDARMLDLGAGAGRDSKYMAQQGTSNNISVTAIEPAAMLAELGKQHTQGLNVRWLQDSLPDLITVTKQEVSFDLILLSAVWMHIPETQCSRSLRKLANLLKPGGKLVISLRHGSSGDERNMLSANVNNIKNIPCKCITYANRKKGVFEVESKTVRAKDNLFLDLTTLNEWEFSLHEHLWFFFTRYASWIEPVLVSEWVKTMASYKGNPQDQSPEKQHQLFNALDWLEAKRTTTEVRKRFDTLQQDQGHQHNYVWSNKSLKCKYAIDHCMPFARWPNNDLWNLLPSDVTENGKKSDRLPTELKIKNSKQWITDWWQGAWLADAPSLSRKTEPSMALSNEQQRFFAEANIALPSLEANNNSVDDLFEALLLQRGRLKEIQQLREWS